MFVNMQEYQGVFFFYQGLFHPRKKKKKKKVRKNLG